MNIDRTYYCYQCKDHKRDYDFIPSDLKEAAKGLWCSCRDCHNLRAKKYKRTFYGKMMELYKRMIRSTRDKKLKKIGFSKHTFLKWCLKQKAYLLYESWVKHHYLSEYAPSVDRIYSNKPYMFSNMQICTWSFNDTKRDFKDGLLFKVDGIPF